MPDNVTLDPPITNIERLLAKAGGMENVDVDDPETRIERYLKAICDRLDSGGTGGGIFVVTFSYDESTETWSADKTFEECLTAWNAGQAMWSLSYASMIALSNVVVEEGNPTYFGFYIADAESGATMGFGIDDNNDAYYYNR